MGHVDDVRVALAAGDVISRVVEEEHKTHLIESAGTALEKRREMERQRRKADREGLWQAESLLGGHPATEAHTLFP